jgi:hypothetical protein
MKKSLLATVAAVALFAGTGLASAAEGAKEQPGMKSGAEIKAEPEMKKGADIKSGAEMKAEPKADTKANADRAKPSTTGQAIEQKSAPAAKSSADDKAAPAAKSATDTKAAPAAKSAADTKAGADVKSNAAAADTKASASAPANLTADQKTKIRTSVLQSSSAPKVSRSQINFTISVGTVVPRTVKFVTVPSTIVEYYPAYRGYSYFIVDDEIIIVEPRSFKIVAVLTV